VTNFYTSTESLKELIASDAIPEDDKAALRDELRKREMLSASITVYLHNRSSWVYTGLPQAVDVLKDLLVPNTLVRGIVVYHGDEKVEQLNYTALKEMRK